MQRMSQLLECAGYLDKEWVILAYGQPLRGIQDPIAINQFGGVYKPDDDGYSLSESLFTELINFTSSEFPALTTRPGYSVVGTFGTRVLGVGSYKDTELHVVFSDGTWRRLNNDGTWTTLLSGLSTSAEWTFTNFKGNLSVINLIAANGTDPVKKYDGTTVTNLANAPSGLSNVVSYANRLYGTVGNRLYGSALGKSDDWTTNKDAVQFDVDSGSGQAINGLIAGNGHVTVLKQSSINELYGTGYNNFRMDESAADIGMNSYKSAAIFDDQVPFIGKNGIYIYGGGVRPSRSFADPVKNYVLGNNQGQLTKCCVGSDGDKMYFGMPNGIASDNNLILQFDPQRKSWYPWENIAVTHFIKVGSKFYMGDSTGRVLLVGGTTDAGGAIAFKAVTKPFTSRSMARRFTLLKLWVTATVPIGSTLDVWVSPDPHGENFKLVKSFTADEDIQYKRTLIPIGGMANINAMRIKLSGTSIVTIHELTRQIREMPMK